MPCRSRTRWETYSLGSCDYSSWSATTTAWFNVWTHFCWYGICLWSKICNGTPKISSSCCKNKISTWLILNWALTLKQQQTDVWPVNYQVWFLGENANYAASEYAWESATPPGTALMMLDADKMVAAASSRNPTLASALTRLQRCAFSGSWEVGPFAKDYSFSLLFTNTWRCLQILGDMGWDSMTSYLMPFCFFSIVLLNL